MELFGLKKLVPDEIKKLLQEGLFLSYKNEIFFWKFETEP